MPTYKIALSPEDRASNTYHGAALWNGRPTNEREQMRRLADLLEAHLQRCGFAVMNLQGPPMRERVARANSWPADLYIAPHTNGFDGTASGTRVHCYPSEKSRRMGRLLQERIAPLSPGKGDKLVESTGLYELRATAMPAVLPEYGFHDNEAEAKWLVEHIPLLASETARAVCDYFAVPYVEDAATANDPADDTVSPAPDAPNAQDAPAQPAVGAGASARPEAPNAQDAPNAPDASAQPAVGAGASARPDTPNAPDAPAQPAVGAGASARPDAPNAQDVPAQPAVGAGASARPEAPAVTWELRRLENGAVVQTWTLAGCE